jgi:ABC-2 type transport system permease protein
MAIQPNSNHQPVAAAGKPALGAFPMRGVPVIHRINGLGLWTLYMKEVRRFIKVQTQTIWAPAATTLLYLMIFTVAVGGARSGTGRMVLGVPFADFLAPGLIVMGMISNAFANTSFNFLALSTAELIIGLIGAAVTRAVLVGLALTLVMALWPGVHLHLAHPWAVLWFGLMGSILLAVIGLIASIWADKFDHAAAITNFVVTPLTMLSGTFYVISNLAPSFQAVSRVNPFFYVISGFRFGFLGQSDIGSTNQAVLHGALGLGLLNIALGAILYALLRSGWKLKS